MLPPSFVWIPLQNPFFYLCSSFYLFFLIICQNIVETVVDSDFIHIQSRNKNQFVQGASLYSNLLPFLQKGSQFVAEPRLSFVEGARDVAVLEAMLESGARHGELVHVKKF